MTDYELIDSGNGRRFEKFGQYLIDRPDPEVLWQKTLPDSSWDQADCKFVRTHEDKGRWETKPNFPESWIVNHNDIKILLKLSPFKHVGVFPEQDWQWDLILNNTPKDSNILNLFGYTGVATVSCLKAGAKVTHVDASRPAIGWLIENLKLNSLEQAPIRYIPEDCLKFVEREIKRGVKYDGIIMDPPVYGHGPNGEKWSFIKDFPSLLDNVSKLFIDNPLYVIINAYAISTSPITLQNMLQEKFSRLGGEITSGELTLKEQSGGRILSTGIWAMWKKV